MMGPSSTLWASYASSLGPPPSSMAFVLFLFSSCSAKSPISYWKILTFRDFSIEFLLPSFQSIKKKKKKGKTWFLLHHWVVFIPGHQGRISQKRHASSLPLGGICYSPNGRRMGVDKIVEIFMNFVCTSFPQNSLWRNFILDQTSISRVFHFETLSKVRALLPYHLSVLSIYCSFHFIKFKMRRYHNSAEFTLSPFPKSHLNENKNGTFNSLCLTLLACGQEKE